MIRAVKAASIGSAAVSRNRFKEDEFLGFEIPLPPIPAQRAIVAQWERTQKEIADAQERLKRMEIQIPTIILSELGIPVRPESDLPKVFALHWKELQRWSVSYLARVVAGAGDIHMTKYPLKQLGEIAQVSYGIQKCPANRPGHHPRPYLRVANVQRGRLDLTEIKYIDVPDSELETFRLKRGDLLVCEGNSADLVGRPAIWNDEIPDCVHQNHILKVRVDPSVALPEFVLEYMQTLPARSHFRARAKFTTNLASINSNDLRELQVPLPPLDLQHEIVRRVAEKRAEIAQERNRVRRLTIEVLREIEEMILGTRPVPVTT